MPTFAQFKAQRAELQHLQCETAQLIDRIKNGSLPAYVKKELLLNLNHLPTHLSEVKLTPPTSLKASGDTLLKAAVVKVITEATRYLWSVETVSKRAFKEDTGYTASEGLLYSTNIEACEKDLVIYGFRRDTSARDEVYSIELTVFPGGVFIHGIATDRVLTEGKAYTNAQFLKLRKILP